MKIISGHQPVYLPWIGLFHKLALCDTFVYMDTVQYLAQDWNNRNKIRTPHGWTWLTVPIDHKKSKGKMLNEIVIRGHDDPSNKKFWQTAHWQSICANYRKADFFKDYEEDLYRLYMENVWVYLTDLCWEQFKLFIRWIGLDDRSIVRMSEFEFSGKKDALVLDHCLKLGGDAVVLGAKGRDYVNVNLFASHGKRIYFQNYHHPTYTQRFPGFEPYMTALDLLMNHGPDTINILMSDNMTKRDLLTNMHWEPSISVWEGE